MKIPQGLKQFAGGRALIIVAGKQDAVFYAAQDGVINRIDAFKIPTPHYSDNEGAFGSRGKGGVFSSGAGRELRDRDIIRDFIHEFTRRINAITLTVTHAYLFAPNQMKKGIAAALPARFRERIAMVVAGNYFSFHPIVLLKKISVPTVVSQLALKPEVVRILSHPRQVRPRRAS